MPMAARHQDPILTGHPCDASSTIVAALATGKVVIQGKPAAVTGDAIALHDILAGSSCVPHPATTGAGSLKVRLGPQRLPASRVGDPADMGIIIGGSSKVIIGG
jgi:uncharacterized Zn-binding protein involved in type VI secretion